MQMTLKNARPKPVGTTWQIPLPDDWHVHLRDGETLARVAPYTARVCGRAIIMPNLKPPVVNLEQVCAYKKRILASTADYRHFIPLMTLYLTKDTDPEILRKGYRDGLFFAVKWYPKGGTTNSEDGVSDAKQLYACFTVMEELGIPLLIHGEATHIGEELVDHYDRETVFLERTMPAIFADFPALIVTLEHITTAEAVEFVREHYRKGYRIGASITLHHLLFNRIDMHEGGFQPLLACMPILKRSRHQEKLLEAALRGEEPFFLGSDSAPHPDWWPDATAPGKPSTTVANKANICGCANGVFTAPTLLEALVGLFELFGRLVELKYFASLNGAKHYGLPPSACMLVLEKCEPWHFTDQVMLTGPDGSKVSITSVPHQGHPPLTWRVRGLVN